MAVFVGFQKAWKSEGKSAGNSISKSAANFAGTKEEDDE